MAGEAKDRSSPSGLWRGAPWIAAAILLMLPLVAMRFTDEVTWDGTDFAAMGALLFGACGAYELAARTTASRLYRTAVGLAVVATVILVWMTLAVGLVGSEDHPANIMFGGVLAVGVVGGLGARFRARGMAWALAGTALAQVAAGLLALAAGWGSTEEARPEAIIGLTGFFVALWLGSAWLFRLAARERARAAAAA